MTKVQESYYDKIVEAVAEAIKFTDLEPNDVLCAACDGVEQGAADRKSATEYAWKQALRNHRD